MIQSRNNDLRPTFADVELASLRLIGVVKRTPSVHSTTLSKHTGAEIVLKLENLQDTGSFKSRGAYVKLASLDTAQRQRGVIAASAGNHAQGVAFHAFRIGIPATIVMPKTTPFIKIQRTEAHGAEVVLHGTTLQDALDEALVLAQRRNLAFISGYDDPLVVSGAATVVLEMLQDFPDLDTLVVPVGGGGLVSGAAIVAKHLRPTIEVVGVQTQIYPSLDNALKSLPPPTGGATIAEGVGVKCIGSLNLEIARKMVDDVLLVDERTIEEAICLLLEEQKILAEGAGAVALAGVLKYRSRFNGKSVGVVISGGNIDAGLLASVVTRARLDNGRVARLSVEILDTPGVLAQVTAIIAEFSANILEIEHRRSQLTLPAKCACLGVTIEMRSPGDISSILERLRQTGFPSTIAS